MQNKIVAYFRTENDAESARSALQSLRVSNLMVDSIPDSGKRVRYIPVAPFGAHWGAAGFVKRGTLLDDEPSAGSDAPMTHLLELEIEETDFEEAMKLLQENNGFKIEEE